MANRCRSPDKIFRFTDPAMPDGCWDYTQAGLLQVRETLPQSPKLHQIPLPPPLRLRKNIVQLLLEERQGER